MGKVGAFLMWVLGLGLGMIALAFLVRNFAPQGVAQLFSFQRA